MLLHNKMRFIGMLIGSILSAFIIMQQPSIYEGVTDRITTEIRRITEPDLWVMSPASTQFKDATVFNPIDIYRIRSISGIEWAVQLYKTSMMYEHQITHKIVRWLVLGIDPNQLIGLPNELLQGNRTSIRSFNAVIIDGFASTLLAENIALRDILIADQKNWVVSGITKPLRTYDIAPMAYVTHDHLANTQYMPSFILVKVKHNQSIQHVADMIQQKTGYVALTKEIFIEKTKQYFKQNTPIVIGFIATAVTGFIIGLMMMWQIFNGFLRTHLHQFGMLKMMGASNLQLMMMVLTQTVFTGCIGYIIALILNLLFGVCFKDTLIAFHFTFQIALLGALGIVFIILFASFSGILKVVRLDSIELCRESI